MKERYIDLMEKALSAYSDAHILRYFNDVKQNGLTEHGFPRLTANIGILISHGRREDLLPIFLEMMDFCCDRIPRVKAANDFSVREILNCIEAAEGAQIADAARIAAWKREIASIKPYECYNKIARDESEQMFNWALFTAVSEYRRNVAGLADTAGIIDVQLATQLRRLDENGMYRDGNRHAPIVYDHAPRGLFAILLRLGYCGKHRDVIDATVKGAALLSLKMQSVTGEMPFGGRSNQFMHNEAWLALIFEHEATRYAKEGDAVLAGRFKAAASRALDNVALWFSKSPIRHVKNRFPTESGYGCEDYAYFDKYMISVASFLHEAYLSCDESIAPHAKDLMPVAWQTSEHFHAVYLRAGAYALEIDTAADPHYDATGLGRVHREGAPSAICMSVPCPATPNYTVDIAPTPLSLCAGVREGGVWQFVADGGADYRLTAHFADKEQACASLEACFAGGKRVTESYTVSENGVQIEVSGEGELAYMLPAFCFDGETYTEICAEAHTLTVAYGGWLCRYETNGEILDLGRVAPNRNGHYRAFAAVGENALHVDVQLLRQEA